MFWCGNRIGRFGGSDSAPSCSTLAYKLTQCKLEKIAWWTTHLQNAETRSRGHQITLYRLAVPRNSATWSTSLLIALPFAAMLATEVQKLVPKCHAPLSKCCQTFTRHESSRTSQPGLMLLDPTHYQVLTSWQFSSSFHLGVQDMRPQVRWRDNETEDHPGVKRTCGHPYPQKWSV